MSPSHSESDIQLKTKNSPLKTLLVVAGDVSGDIHAARLAREVLARHPNRTLYVVGGAQLQALARESGRVEVIGDTIGYGVIGFASVLAILPRVLKLRRQTLRFMRSHSLDGAVLCDWGAFNGRLLPNLKAQGVPVLYYFPPRSWQKHGNGGLGIVPFVERVATPFEWSAQRLQAVGCQAEWVGHPLLEYVRPSQPRPILRQEFGTPDGASLIALLPGSRAMELHYIAPHIVAAAELLRAQRALHFVAVVPAGDKGSARRYFPEWVTLVEGRAADVLLACDAAIVKSGTATLEAAVADAPQIVVYDVPLLLRAQWRLTGANKKVPFVAMPNIILEREAVPELLGDSCRAEPICRALQELLDNAGQRAKMREDYALVRRALGAELPLGATERTMAMVEEMLGAQPGMERPGFN